jgi:hypothetical protein
MKNSASQWIPLFPQEEIPFILAAVLRSGERLKKLHRGELENDLSDRLRDKLDRDASLRTRPVELFREVPIYDRKRSRQKQLGRTDIIFLYSTGATKPWPYFVIEAKRLHVAFPSGWQSLVSEYVTGEQGMMCFINERYARNLKTGGMLGFVFDGDIDGARASVAASVKEKRTELKCRRRTHFQESTVLGSSAAGIGESIHSLSHGAFTIYHLFLAV